MDEVHKHRINENIANLLEHTMYGALVHSFERMDKTKIITETLLRKWQERRQFGFSNKQLNMKLYEEIQRRGPQAFQLLIDCLKDSGHHDLACLLDPTQRVIDTSEAESTNQEMEFYSEEGSHIVYIDNSWEGEECKFDRKALRDLFVSRGFTETQVFPKKDVGSFVVINFSSVDVGNSGGVLRENDWVHNKFHDPCLDGKPKILISFRYNKKKESKRNAVEHDSAPVRKLYRDLLWVKIYLEDANSNSIPEEISQEVKHLIQIFSVHHPVNFRDKLREIQNKFERHNLKPLNIHDSGFSKQFRLNKHH